MMEAEISLSHFVKNVAINRRTLSRCRLDRLMNLLPCFMSVQIRSVNTLGERIKEGI